MNDIFTITPITQGILRETFNFYVWVLFVVFLAAPPTFVAYKWIMKEKTP